jgi:hypothetical protein
MLAHVDSGRIDCGQRCKRGLGRVLRLASGAARIAGERFTRHSERGRSGSPARLVPGTPLDRSCARRPHRQESGCGVSDGDSARFTAWADPSPACGSSIKGVDKNLWPQFALFSSTCGFSPPAWFRLHATFESGKELRSPQSSSSTCWPASVAFQVVLIRPEALKPCGNFRGC